MEMSEEKNESDLKKLKYPKAMPFILCNIFVERYCSAGISGTKIKQIQRSIFPHFLFSLSAILALYFHVKLNLDTNSATSVFHIHECLVYFFTIVGAIIADSILGHFKTIIIMAFIYSVGAVTVSIGNIEPLNLPTL